MTDYRRGWLPVPPKYVRRWAIQGRRPDGNPATTIFDILDDRQHVAVYPATVATFAVLIDGSAVEMLLSAVETRDACAVPAWHAEHGDRLLGLRPVDVPHEPAWTAPPGAPRYLGPVELYLVLPGKKIEIRYGRDRWLALRNALGDISDTRDLAG